MLNANLQLNLNTKSKAKTAEKLSSGYRINRAADDAAGLSISEKMRWMIRGLNKGTENAQDGVSWVQIGDGSLEETHDMLHRMTQLAIKASNETCTDVDRAMMQAEFDQLQKEIDRLTDNTYFNEKHIFKDHEYPYYQIEGATRWSQSQLHKVRDGENDLVITYREQNDDDPKTATITVAAGEYTTKELIDEIDTAFEKAGLLKDGIMFEYTKEGYCNLNLEGGEKIDEISGGLSYLLYDNFGGGDLGALIGTTLFRTENSAISIVADTNDFISFKLLDPEDPKEEKGPAKTVSFTVSPGSKTKAQLIDMLKQELINIGVNKDTDGDGIADEEVVKVEDYGQHIKMSSEQYILSEFKGNMFKVDDGNKAYTSIFYDNIHEVQNVQYMPAEFRGAGVLQVTRSGSDYDPQAAVFHIEKGKNNILVIRPNEMGEEITLDLTDLHGQTLDGKTMDQACAILNDEMEQLFGSADVPLKFSSIAPTSYETKTDNNGVSKQVGYSAMRITTTTAEPGKYVGIDKAKSTAYSTLFTLKGVTAYKNDATFGGNDTVFDSNAKLIGGRDLTNGLQVTDDNNTFHITIGRVGQPALSADITLDNSAANGKYSFAELQAQIQKKLNDAFKDAPDDMKDDQGRVLVVSNSGGHIVLTGATEKTASIRVGAVGENKGYTDIFPDERLTPKYSASAPKIEIVPPANGAKFEKDASGKTIVTIPSAHDGDFVVWVDGKARSLTGAYNLYNAAPNKDGKWELEELENYINEKLGPEVNPIYFPHPFRAYGDKDEITAPTGNISDEGHTYTSVPAIYTKTGTSTWTGPQGEGGELKTNTSPMVTTGKDLDISATNQFKFTSQKFTLTKGDGSKKEFTVTLNKSYSDLNTLKTDLQTEINKQLGTNQNQVGGIVVGVSGKRLTFSVNLGTVGSANVLIGDETTLALDTNSQFLKDLHSTKTKAEIAIGATEKKKDNYYWSTKGVNDSFTPTKAVNMVFYVKKPGSATETKVTVALTSGTTYTKPTLLSAINGKLNGQGYNAAYDSNGRLVIAADDAHAGDGHGIRFDATASDEAMKFVFGYKGSYTKGYSAEGTLPLQVQKTVKIEAGKQDFKIRIDSKDYTVKLAVGTYGAGGTKALSDIAKQIVTQTKATSNDRLKVSIDASGNMHIETTSAKAWDGSSGSMIEVLYDDSATSAMPAIFGCEQTAGAEVKFIQSGGTADAPKYKLQITRKVDSDVPDPVPYAPNRRVQVISDTVDAKEHSTSYQGGSFIYSDTRDVSPEYDDGHHSGDYSYMQGVSLADKLNENGRIEINEYNNTLTFYFTENYGTDSATQKITIDGNDLPTGEYEPEGLIAQLQQAINAKTDNKQKINVVLKNGGIRLESANAGRKYRIFGKNDGAAVKPSGTFYDKVLCSSRTASQGSNDIKNLRGYAAGGEVYAVGRQDVKNNEVRIQKDGNDYLTLEFTYPTYDNAPEAGRKTVRLEMTLDPGYYKGDKLVEQIQKQLDKALEEAGLPKGLIEAGIDTIKHDVVITGAINDRALAFKLSETVKGPAQGAYGIAAIGGTAAFSVFYATEGDIARAYIRGGKDISGGVEVKEGEEEFSVDVDGVTYTIKMDPGKYTADELVDHINSLMHADPDNKVPLVAVMDEGRLKLMHSKYGKHKITNLQGRIKDRLFFGEKGAKKTEEPIHLRLSSVSGDWTDIERPWMNTLSLGINSLTISKYKYAQKAIERVKQAVTKVSEVRSYFGAKQNQLESTIRNNENKAENTTAAESRIRDADVAKEVMENAIHNILEQAGVSMLTQTKQNAQLALQLLS